MKPSLNAFATARELGLMQGFPPPVEKRVNRSNALLTSPFNRWSYQHMRTIYPSAPVGNAEVSVPIELAIDSTIDELIVPHPDGRSLDFGTYLEESFTDAMIVVRPEGIVYEAYLNDMGPDQPHQMMSATKSFAGLFGLMAVEAGQLSEDDLVIEKVPELATSGAFADATFGQVLDMVNSMEFNEDYADPKSDIVRYGQTLGWLQAPADALPADNLYDYLVTLPKDPSREHGEVFHYQTPKTDVVNWVTNRATGLSFQDNMTDVLWSKLGTQGETYVLLDRNGTLVAGGGLNACPRDLARFGMMLISDGAFNGRQVIEPGIIDQLARGASRQAFAAGPDAIGAFANGDWSYRAQWWTRHTPGHEAFTAMGIHGQWIYIDRERKVGIIKHASQPISLDEGLDQLNLDAFDSIIAQVSR